MISHPHDPIITPKIAIVCSTADPASANIHRSLLATTPWQTEGTWHNHPIYTTHCKHTRVHLYLTDQDSTRLEHIDESITAFLFIFPTKHQSKAGIPSLSVHAPGNWSTAEMGGSPATLGIWPALVTDTIYRSLKHKNAQRNNNDNNTKNAIEVIFEATHHGPQLETPCCFVEIGSSMDQWQRQDLGVLVATVILETCEQFPTAESLRQTPHAPVCIGIGGLHTGPRFSKQVDANTTIISHICPHYQLEHLTEPLIRQAMRATVPITQKILVDWKGLKSHKVYISTLLDTLEKQGVHIEKLR